MPGFQYNFKEVYYEHYNSLPSTITSYSAMAAEAEAAREARAKVIAAEGEQKASKSLAAASNVMAESCAALQLRYLQVERDRDYINNQILNQLLVQTLSSISAEKNQTIIFPLPADIIRFIIITTCCNSQVDLSIINTSLPLFRNFVD